MEELASLGASVLTCSRTSADVTACLEVRAPCVGIYLGVEISVRWDIHPLGNPHVKDISSRWDIRTFHALAAITGTIGPYTAATSVGLSQQNVQAATAVVSFAARY